MVREANRSAISMRISKVSVPIMHVMKGIAKGKDIIDLSQGVPFFGPPEDAVRETIKEINGLNSYGPDDGDIELREEVTKKLSNRNSIDTETEGVMITSGANIGFFNAVSTLCDVNDEVILLDPYYFNHGMTLDILGVKHKHVPTDDRFQPDPDIILENICEKTKAIVMISPNNPTGAVYPEAIIRRIADICSENGLWLISDETYEEFIYEGSHFSPGSLGEDLPVISLFSMSKGYGMSGWRIGYMAFPKEIRDSIMKVQDTTVICPSRIGQRLALHCLREHHNYISKYLEILRSENCMISSWLAKNKDILTGNNTQGAYYSLPRPISERWNGRSMELAKAILESSGVLLVPGGAFNAGSPARLRLSFGNIEPEALVKALERLTETFPNLI